MTLKDFIYRYEPGTEITVLDKEYDIECYFYTPDEKDNLLDKWDVNIIKLAEMLEVIQQNKELCVVDFGKIIRPALKKLKKSGLFCRATENAIMDTLHSIISGYVSDEWLEKFVTILCESNGVNSTKGH